MSGTKTIKISNIPISYVKELDKIAKKLSEKEDKKVSRNELLKRMVVYNLEQDYLINVEERFEKALNQNEIVTNNLLEEMKKFTDSLEETLTTVMTNSENEKKESEKIYKELRKKVI